MLKLDDISTKELYKINHRMNDRIDEARKQIERATSDLKRFVEVSEMINAEPERRKNETETVS